MALVLKDRVKEQTTTTGTGSVTLGGAVSGFEAFSAVGDGNTTYYAIVHQTADEWEVGLGTYTAAGTLLSRDTILESSNSDAAVVFSAGTKDVFVTYPSDKAVYYDAAGTVNIDSLRLVAGVTVTSILDEDNMASDSATALSTQQSIKAYVDAQVGTADTLSEVLALGNTTGGTDIAMTGGDKITNFESTGINDDAASTTITINSAGNVGIGTSTLNGTLLVIDQNGTDAPSSSGNMTTGSFLGAVSVGGAALNIGHDADGTWYNSAYFNNAGVARIHRWLTGGAESMRIDTSGNVGIGISSPATKFHVLDGTSSLRFRQNGTVAETLTVGPSGGDAAIYLGDVADTVRAGLYYDTSENDLQIRGYNNSTRILIDSSGNVGIGTSSPTQALEVAGTIRSSISSALSSYIATTSGGGGFFIEPDDYSAANPVWEIKTYASEPLAFQMGGTERMRIESSGNVGIGTTSPSGILDISAATGSGTFNIISTDNATGAGNKIAFFAANRSDTDEEMAYIKPLLVTNSGGSGNVQSGQLTFGTFGSERMRIDEDGNVGIGTSTMSAKLDIVPANNSRAWESTVNDTVANQNLYANLIDYNLSGSDATTTDRTHVGLRLDIDSSASGGDTSNEHRIYGIWNDIDVTADSDLVYGTYTSVRTTHTTGTITEMRGSYNLVEADGTGTVTNAYGSYNYALSGTAVSGLLNGYGSFNKYGKEAADTSTLNNAHGVYAEVECDAGTITNAYGVRSIIDRDGGTVSNGYLYRGEYQGTYSSGTQWGVYLSGEEKSYFSNNVGIGTTSPVKKLHVAGPALATIGTLTDSATITPNFDTNQNFSVTLGGNRTLANPSNVDAGQTGSIFVVQDATGGRTLSFGSYWKFAGGTAPTLSTGANAVDRIDYIVKSSTEIHAVASLNLS